MDLHQNKTIFVDIDGTLYRDGELDRKLIRWIKFKKGQGFVFNLWSARGKDYAEQFVSAFGLPYIFDAVLSKPGCIIDDRGWTWTEYVKQIDRDQVLLELGEMIDDGKPQGPKNTVHNL
jgi:hydroxymethylpyrimidine pyrophosphatase-like HAD family hydrolase